MDHFSAERIACLITYTALADAISSAFVEGGITAPPRMHLPSGPGQHDAVLVMPAWRNEGLGVVKVVTVRSANARRSLPTVQGTALIFDAASGTPLATADATTLTRWRTAATSLLASRYLANNRSTVLMMAGSGGMAGHLVRAFCSEFPIQEVLIWSRTPSHAAKLAKTLELPARVSATEDLEGAVRRADIVSCATLAETGLISGAWVRPGTHIDLVGGFTPAMRESDDELIQRAEIYVDSRTGALREAGDLVRPLAAGVISAGDIRGELTDLIRSGQSRAAPGAITLFKSVGHAIEDLAAVDLLLKRSRG